MADQPRVLEATIAGLLPLRGEIRQLAAGRRHVLISGRGTSDNAGVYGRYLVEWRTGLGAALAAPSLATHYRVRRDLTDTVLLSLSQSGATSEIVDVQRWARSCGARTIAITNQADSELAIEADLALVTAAGTERAVPATKSYTAQLAAVAVLAEGLGPDEGSLEQALLRVPDEVARLLEDRDAVDAAVDALAAARHILVSGRGLVYGTALELALKVEETCLRPVRGLSYADLRHGPIATVDAGTAVVVIVPPDGPMVRPMTEVATDVRRLGAVIVGIGGDEAFRRVCHVATAGPDLPEALAPLGLAVPAQQIAEALARRLGLDTDAPRGLSKITQTDPPPGGGS